MRKTYRPLTKILMLSGLLACTTPTFSATPIDLSTQSSANFQSLITSPNNIQTQKIRDHIDFNKTQHIRLQQMYTGSRVWGGDFIVHIKNGNVSSLREVNDLSANAISMDGFIYHNLDKDLQTQPHYITSDTQSNKALQESILSYQKKTGLVSTISEQKIETIVFIDSDNKAHWAFLISFISSTPNKIPAKPTAIVDAATLKTYKQWNDIKTLSDVFGGGYGGNEKVGRISYDGLTNNFPKLDIQRDDETSICYMQNNDVTVKNASNGGKVMQYECSSHDETHNNVFWNADQDKVNGGNSPSNDALYVGKVIKRMYTEWYNIPVLIDRHNKPMMLNMQVHVKMDNAYWNGREMFFGDGISEFYPLVSLGIGAHEISHGFTEQHSDLAYYEQSGGLNESFSDMAAQAAEYYSAKRNTWKIGEEVTKDEGDVIRYMDEPTKDCNGRRPGNGCSINNAKQYRDYYDVHYTSGVFNKFFYLLSTSINWDTHKAFDVMVAANRNYWTSTVDFKHAACGILKAAKDYNYPDEAIKNAANKVGVSITKCK